MQLPSTSSCRMQCISHGDLSTSDSSSFSSFQLQFLSNYIQLWNAKAFQVRRCCPYPRNDLVRELPAMSPEMKKPTDTTCDFSRNSSRIWKSGFQWIPFLFGNQGVSCFRPLGSFRCLLPSPNSSNHCPAPQMVSPSSSL